MRSRSWSTRRQGSSTGTTPRNGFASAISMVLPARRILTAERLAEAAARSSRRMGDASRIEGRAVRARTPGREARSRSTPSSPTSRFLPLELRFVVDEFTAQGPDFRRLPQGRDRAGRSGRLAQARHRRSTRASSQDVVRLWPQFINPDVRDWASHNLHGGQIEGNDGGELVGGRPRRDGSQARRSARQRPWHVFERADVGVDLLAGPADDGRRTMGAGTFTGRNFTVSGDHATMTLSPTRRIQGDNLVFTVPDTTPRPIVDAQARAHLTGPPTRLPICSAASPCASRRACRSIRRRSRGRRTAISFSTSSSAKPPSPTTRSFAPPARSPTLRSTNSSARRSSTRAHSPSRPIATR